MLGPVFCDNMLAQSRTNWSAMTGDNVLEKSKIHKKRDFQQHEGQGHEDSVDQQQDGTLRKTLWT